MKLNENEKLCLVFLVGATDEDFSCCAFAPIQEWTKLERKDVRRAVRSLRRKGLAEFHSGLWTEDGTPAGSGYCASVEGRKFCRVQYPDELDKCEREHYENW